LQVELHRAVVTQAALHYEGSITSDAQLAEAADMLPYERVEVVDIANGARFEIYVVTGTAGSGTSCVNGAAARLVRTAVRAVGRASRHATRLATRRLPALHLNDRPGPWRRSAVTT
jgi:aspartate 1-decarboxylase